MKKLYVGNLSYEVNEESLQTAFAEYGEVRSVAIIQDRYTGQSRGFGFVEMERDNEADAAIAGLNGKDLGGRALTVYEARPRADRGGGGRGGGGHGGGGRGRGRNGGVRGCCRRGRPG